MKSLQYYCILGLAEIKTYAQKMQDAQVTKLLHIIRKITQNKENLPSKSKVTALHYMAYVGFLRSFLETH